jgi:hypothetical protein
LEELLKGDTALRKARIVSDTSGDGGSEVLRRRRDGRWRVIEEGRRRRWRGERNRGRGWERRLR